MTIEIVDCPIENGGSFHSYVKLPKGKEPPIYGMVKTKAQSMATAWSDLVPSKLQPVPIAWRQTKYRPRQRHGTPLKNGST